MLSRDLHPIRWHGCLLLSHSNLSNVRAFKRPLLCEWLEKMTVHHVIGCLGKPNGRHKI